MQAALCKILEQGAHLKIAPMIFVVRKKEARQMFRRMLTAGAIVGLCLGLLQSAIAPAVQAQGTPCAIDTEEAITALVTEFTTAFAAHDVQGMAALASPDVARDFPRGDDLGVDDMVASFEELFTIFPDMTVTVNLVLVDAPLAAVHFTATGTQAASLAGTEPTGEAATWDGMFLIAVDCGKISQMWTEVDQLSQRNQSTSIPATPVAAAEGGTPDACPALTDETAQALMDTWYHDVWTGDLEVLGTITTADVYHHWAMGPDSSGQAEQMERVQGTLAMLEGLTSGYDAIIVDGEYIAVHWTQTLGDDTWGGLNIFRTECGSIDEVWSEMNLNDLPGQEAEATPAG
jgi:predicted SnoaL-like aldol condensation-catalyzing enzyme